MNSYQSNLRPECVHRFLQSQKSLHNNSRLLDLYDAGMEVQVNVTKKGGEPVEGMRNTFTDGKFTWSPLRVVNAEDAEETVTYPFDLYATDIGLSGWSWLQKRSKWVAFDFDDLISHAPGIGISDEELAQVREAVSNIPWVEVRRSTGGGGLHLVVCFADPGIATEDHDEHAALARCVLGMMSTLVGFDLSANVDCCGRIIWIWSLRATPENEGFVELKASTEKLPESNLPENWRDHLEVVKHRRTKVRIRGVDAGDEPLFTTLASAFPCVPLDDAHNSLIEHLLSSGFSTIWVPDHHLLQTHTVALKKTMADATVRKSLGLIGVFDTVAEGKDPGEANCFMFPRPNGAWRVFRFSPGVSEAPTWTQDGETWTRCDFNCRPTLAAVALAMGGVEDPDKPGFVFDGAAAALEAAKMLGQDIALPREMMDRKTRLKSHKDGRLITEVEKREGDGKLRGWVTKKDVFSRVFNVVATPKGQTKAEPESNYDGIVRALITPAGEHAGFMVWSDEGSWDRQTVTNAKMRLQSLGAKKTEAECILGTAIGQRWTLVNVPFQPEFLGNRQWNVDAAQLRFQPARLADDESPQHPHWDKVLQHIGASLDESVKNMEWCQQHDIVTGADWLLYLIACILRDPFEPTPYLFLWGPENSGKSILHEAFSLLVTKGVVRADRALTNPNNFNGELANAILAVVEETDLSKSGCSHDRMKDWVTNLTLSIRRMRTDQYQQRSTLHFVQCANRLEYCPVWPGDSRITVCHVPALKDEDRIPKKVLLKHLENEAPHFLATIMGLSLSEPTDRLRIPVVETPDKMDLGSQNAPVSLFMKEKCVLDKNASITKKDLYHHYERWSEENGYKVEDKRHFGIQLREFSGGTVEPRGKAVSLLDEKRHDAYQGIRYGHSA